MSVLAAATPWPYNVFVQIDAWTGLRPGEMIALRVGDVHLPPDGAEGESWLSGAESVAVLDGESVYLDPKTEGSVRDVLLTADTADRLRAYLAVHPNLHDPEAPLFPAFSAVPLRPPYSPKCLPGTRCRRAGCLRLYAMRGPNYALLVMTTYPRPTDRQPLWRTLRPTKLPRG